MTKEFITAAKAVTDGDDDDTPAPLEFKIDGEDCVAFYPGDGQLAVLMAMTSQHAATEEKIAGTLNFFVSVLDDHTHTYVVNKLLDRKDPFGIEKVQEIMQWMVEQWSGRPTKQPADYLPSRSSGGRKSTRRTPALTSSD